MVRSRLRQRWIHMPRGRILVIPDLPFLLWAGHCYLLLNLNEENWFEQCRSVLCQVLYDGLCPICVAEIRFLELVQRNIKPGRVSFVDISLAGYDGAKHGNVSYEMAMEAMHVIDEKEQVRV